MKFYALGVGPGDKELITVKALNILKNSDIIYTPQSDETGRSIALDIIKDYLPEEKIKMYYFPMNNNKEELNKRYTELAAMIKNDLNKGLTVSYVTIGDPLIYSTFNYLYEKLEDVDVKIIPGIASFLAASSIIKKDIVQKGESFCVIEPEHLSNFDRYIELFDTIIIMKAHRGLEKIRDLVEKYSMIKEAYLVSRAGLDGEEILNLKKDVPNKKVYLSIAFLKIDKNKKNKNFITSKKGERIEKESFEIIDTLVDLSTFNEYERSVVKRVIHACGDPEIAKDIIFSKSWMDKVKELIDKNTVVICDVEMVKVGIGNKYGNVKSFINDDDVIERSKDLNLTRSEIAIEKAFNLYDEMIFVIGNAPTSLLKILELQNSLKKNIFVIGMPVGFVSAKESKEMLTSSRLEYITIKGYKGGSPLAAAAFNAILRIFKK